jgi:hypothetical protein
MVDGREGTSIPSSPHNLKEREERENGRCKEDEGRDEISRKQGPPAT